MPELYDTIRRIILDEMRRFHFTELGIVQEVQSHADESDKDNYTCTVTLRNSAIVLKQVPVMTSRIGQTSIPQPGNLVVIQFVNANINAPIITGCLYNEEETPPVNSESQIITRIPGDAEDADAVAMEIEGGETKRAKLTIGSAAICVVQDDEPIITIDVGEGKAVATIASDGGISLESKEAITIKGKEITIESDADMALKAGGNMKLEGTKIDLN